MFKRIAVIGAGVMGAGIAAQAANAGVEVLLLDIVPKEGDRNALAKGAIEKLKKSNPAALMLPAFAARITPGNLEDDLKALKECDWIIEVVIEKLEVKKALFAKIAKYRRDDAIVSSNTSTLPLAVLTEGLKEDFKQHFLITHFFNPPRYLRLLEVVKGPETLPEVVEKVSDFADRQLGKTVVPCHDTPGFIANRIGTYWLHAAIGAALEMGVGVEEADAVLGKPAGVPNTGVFGLLDLVGLDVIPHVLGSLMTALPKSDDFHKLGPVPDLLPKMIAEGNTGRKGKGGFYRLNANKEKEVLRLKDAAYVPVRRPKVEAAKAGKKGGLRAVFEHDSLEGKYAWRVMSGLLAYTAEIGAEMADSIEQIDAAMRLGYNWKYGPFELLDKVGPAWFAARLKAEGRPVPALIEKVGAGKFYRVREGRLEYFAFNGAYKMVLRPTGVLLLEDIKRASKPLFGNWSSSVWDLGDGVACVEYHSKMNAFDPLMLWSIRKAIRTLPGKGFKAMVLYNEADNYSVGANLFLVQLAGKLGLWPLVRWFVGLGQDVLREMKFSSFPTVAAPAGLALGGACETLLHARAIVAHAETYTGLVEVGVGIIPGWGGCTEMVLRALNSRQTKKGPMPAVVNAFEKIATAQVAKSAFEAREMLILREDDEIIMNRDRLLFNAKKKALLLAKTSPAPAPQMLALPGPSGATALELGLQEFVKKGLATPHDVVVGRGLAKILTGGATDHTVQVSEDAMRKLEREVIIDLAKTGGTKARIAHILKTGKPLRN
ncbi:MAG TPA: 3-hydroxyacyl-CoA dehydrogenase NAD-binding domain-containing protein [Alphaproteobacteria bacterium]|nr:3-hydroxyacyl-CoA dehydrogenase NAD-binding domain-containing protein [Alphaproteobacteria bacterium]